MNVSLAWLSEYVDLPSEVSALCELLTFAGVEVERVETRGAAFAQVVVAQILASDKHPNADRLSVCSVDDGSGTPRQIVCGAKNYKVGDKVPLALPGAVLPGDFKIKAGKLRGVESNGMLCSAKELNLAEDADGLLILPSDSRVGAPIGELFPPDTVLELEITPNRPDLLSHLGIAREIAALTGATLRAPATLQDTDAAPAAPDAGLSASIEDPSECPCYTLRAVRGVKVGPSPEWLRRRLESVGLRPVNNVVDITNFVLLECGQPLHAFDAARISGGIAVRSARPSEKLLALDGREYALLPEDLVIADATGPVAIAGVMGGEGSGVGETTTDILLESARFRPSAVRATSRRLGLISDSSYRFERGVDPHGVLAASRRAIELILQTAGGEASAGPVIAGEPQTPPTSVQFRPARCAALLGDTRSAAESTRILSGFWLRKLPGETAGSETWQIPSWRPDLVREVDLIEEVARVFGIDRLPAGRTARVAPASEVDRAYDFRMSVARRLVGAGFAEARTLSLIAPTTAALDPLSGGEGALALRNPLSEDTGRLRPSLLPGLLRVASHNARQGAGRIRLFEIGRVYGGEPEERTQLGILLAGPVASPSWRDARPRAADFHDLKGVVEMLLAGADVAFERIEGSQAALAVRVVVGGTPVGHLFQALPSVAREIDLPGGVTLAALDLGILRGLLEVPFGFRAIDRYPAVVRDMAFVVPRELPHARVIEVVTSAKEPLLAGVEVFDVFEDPQGNRVPAGQKSLAYSLTYRSSERTLTVEEVNAAHERLKAVLVRELGAAFRE